MNKLVITLVVTAFVTVGLFLIFLEINTIKTTSIENELFKEKIQQLALIKGFPIEGFSADIYLNSYENLKAEDFDTVESLEGKYEFKDGQLIFRRNPTPGDIQTFSSAERTISSMGYTTLLRNLRNRLGNKPVEEVVSLLNFKASNFEECVKAGNPVMESYPMQCRSNGKTFVQIVLSKNELIKLGQFIKERYKTQNYEIISVQNKDWSDSCLGISEGKMCAQVITPGYLITLKLIDGEYFLRSDEALNIIKEDI